MLGEKNPLPRLLNPDLFGNEAKDSPVNSTTEVASPPHSPPVSEKSPVSRLNELNLDLFGNEARDSQVSTLWL